MNKSFSLITCISLSILFPSAVYSLEAANATERSLTAQISEQDVSVSSAARIDIEDRIQGTPESLTREYTFQGNENELVVAYREAIQGSRFATEITITAPSGEPVAGRYSSHMGLNLNELDGTHQIFLLPETGEYQLTFKRRLPEEVALEAVPTEPEEYLLRARLAPYSERQFIHAFNLLDDERYEEATAAFTLAIEADPAQPLPYIGRIMSYSLPVIDTVDDSEYLQEEDFFSATYRIFQRFNAETQATITSDLRQAGVTTNLLLEEGKTTLEKIEIAPDIFAEGADFLETGETTEEFEESILEMFFPF